MSALDYIGLVCMELPRGEGHFEPIPSGRLGRLKIILGGTENAVEFYVAKNQPRNQKSTEGNDPPLFSLFWTFDFLP